MRHGNIHKKFGREAQHRMAMLHNQVLSLIQVERITTTDVKAKEVRKIVEKVITLGKKGGIHNRRIAYKTVPNREAIAKVFGPLAERFKTRPGGYTRILKIGNRHGDAAPMSLLMFLEGDAPAAAKSEDKADKPAKKAKAPKAEKADDAEKPAKKKAKK